MVVVTLAGGLGNQLFRYAMGLAVATRNRARLALDVKFYVHVAPPDTPRAYELWRFNISGRPMGAIDKVYGIASGTYPRAGWSGRLIRRLPVRRLTRFVDPHAGFDPPAAAAPDFSFLDGHWQSARYFADVRDRLLAEYTLREGTSAADAAVLRQVEAAPAAVCVHVRRGDYLQPTQILQALPLEYYQRALTTMAGRAPTSARYFVFSDDPAWARANVPVPADAVYVNHNVGVNDAADLRLMARCTHFVIANSSFSWWAAWLGRAADKVVVAPRRWFAKPHPSEPDLLPDRWIRL